MNITKEQIKEWLLKMSNVVEEGDFEWLLNLIHDCIHDLEPKWVSIDTPPKNEPHLRRFLVKSENFGCFVARYNGHSFSSEEKNFHLDDAIGWMECPNKH